jgi:uncharacterized membrane protein
MLDGGKRGRLDGPPKAVVPAARPAPPAPAPARGSGQSPPAATFGASAKFEASAGPHRHGTDASASHAAEVSAAARQQAGPSSPPVAGQFDLNRPTLIALFYIGSVVFGPLAFVGAVMAYVSRGEQREAWEASHYQYLIRTFWIGFIGIMVSIALFAIFIGIFTLLGAIGLVIVRSVTAINLAQKREPVPDPSVWLV